MNVFLLDSTVINTWSGVNKWMLMTAKGLRKRGHSIYCGGKLNSLFTDVCIKEGFNTYFLKFGMDYSIINGYRLSRILRRHQIDAVIGHYNKDVKIAGIARMFFNRFIIVARAGLPSIRNTRRHRYIYKRMFDGIITNTKAIKRKYLSYGWMEDDIIRVIQNGIEINVSNDFDFNSIRQQYNLPKQRPVIGIFGRLEPQKQINLFLDVAQNVRNEYPEAIFLIVGDGSLKDKIQRYACDLGIDDNVIIMGHQSKLDAIYTYCDIVLLTSASEGVPNVLIEAMLFSRPVVAFNVGGVQELIQSGKTGVVVPPNDVQSMTKETLRLIKSDEIRESLGRAAKRHIKENYSIDKMATSIEYYLKELIDRKSNGKTQPQAVYSIKN
ncbi:MAG: glycosyltransferase family 4 protein [Candidatus Marinimicrobia bacterium]|nr:glycosyltransferase family 4 protein [Candidatus Neomarinimicrobiota bacterium]